MSQIVNVNELFKSAHEDGLLSQQSIQTLNVKDMSAQIQAALGLSADDFTSSSECILVSMMPDDSGSIRFVQGNTQAVRDGHNLVLDALGASKQKGSILAHTRYLNGHILFPYCPLEEAVRMDTHNYDPNLGTPFYDQSVVFVGTVLAKTQEFAENGIPVRSVSLMITDGHDEHSKKHTASSVSPIIHDMLMQEMHIVAAMGIDDTEDQCRHCGYEGIRKLGVQQVNCPQCKKLIRRTDFRKIFQEMGIEDRWILTPGNSPSEIRKAFAMFSQSAVRASQGAASFSKTAMGGFGAP